MTDLEVHCQIHRHEITTYNKLCIIAKSNHYLGHIEEASGDPKTLNHVLKSILRRDEVIKLPLYSSQDTLANQFASLRIRPSRDGLPVVEAPVVYLPPCNSELCVFVPVTISAVSRIVMKTCEGMCPRSIAYLVAEGASIEHSSSHDIFHQLLPAVECCS